MSFAPRPKNRLSRAGDPFTFRDRLVELWTRAPSTTIVEAMRATGASKSVTEHVAKQLRAAGKLPSTKWSNRELIR